MERFIGSCSTQRELTKLVEGSVLYEMEIEEKDKKIIIRFEHPTGWIGLDKRAATELRNQLTKRLADLL